jgi:hypothetical protein
MKACFPVVMVPSDELGRRDTWRGRRTRQEKDTARWWRRERVKRRRWARVRRVAHGGVAMDE